RLAGLSDLHLGGPAAATLDYNARRNLGRDRGHGHVDRDPIPQRRWETHLSRLERRLPPRRQLSARVVEERSELAPTRRTLHQHRLAHGDPAEAGAHRDRHDDTAHPPTVTS